MEIITIYICVAILIFLAIIKLHTDSARNIASNYHLYQTRTALRGHEGARGGWALQAEHRHAKAGGQRARRCRLPGAGPRGAFLCSGQHTTTTVRAWPSTERRPRARAHAVERHSRRAVGRLNAADDDDLI